MRDRVKHYSVNWIDGMKINKSHFISQDDAYKDALQDVAALNLSPLRYGILPPSFAAENTFNLKISVDNQNTLRVTVLSCQAITSGGARINLPALSVSGLSDTDGVPATSFQLQASGSENIWWIVLYVHPFEKQPAGSADLSENPPRFPYILPAYSVQVLSENQYRQFAQHPYALIIGKAVVNGSEVRIEENYIPPCFSISANSDLVTLHAELDQFLATLETLCSKIVQKIFVKKQQNDISELVLFLCDRVMLYLAQAITNVRWTMMHESPAALFATVANLARVMKNTIDLRIGSGKEEMMNYFSDWGELKQGEFESMLSNTASIRFDNNDVNKNIEKVIVFVKITSRLFETLSKLEFIGKRKESGIFVKEERTGNIQQPSQTKRRFFG